MDIQVALALIAIGSTVIGTVVAMFNRLLQQVMKQNAEREKRYLNTIDSLVVKFDTITDSVDGLTDEVRKKAG